MPGVLPYNPSVFNQKITRPARRIYVGNLPVGPVYTDSFFLNFFIRETRKIRTYKYKGVLSFWIAPEKTYGFCEFVSVKDADRATVELNGLMIGGRQLRCGRPTDYEPVPDYLSNYYVGGPIPRMPHDFDIFKYMHIFGGTPNQPSPEAKKKVRPIKPKEMPIPGRGSLKAQLRSIKRSKKKSKRGKKLESSRAFRIEGMLRSTELVSTSTYKEILYGIRSYVSWFGDIEALYVPRKGELATDAGVGNVYVLYSKLDDSDATKDLMEKRLFEGRSLIVTYFDESKFSDMDLD